jgi:hypothetical protein
MKRRELILQLRCLNQLLDSKAREAEKDHYALLAAHLRNAADNVENGIGWVCSNVLPDEPGPSVFW